MDSGHRHFSGRETPSSSRIHNASPREFKLNGEVHVTAQMVNEAILKSGEGQTLAYNHAVLGTIKLCGKLIGRTLDKGIIGYTISDGTGCIAGSMRTDETSGKSAIEDMEVGEMLIVTGVMKQEGMGWELDTIAAEPIAHENYMAFHRRQIFQEQMHLMTLPLQNDEAGEILMNVAVTRQSTGILDSAKRVKHNIMQILKEPLLHNSELGSSAAYLAYRLHKREPYIKLMLEQLEFEGFVVRTIDTSHYKIA
ncbi:hypothetical protein ACP70R_022997 [Stipagrostis hirtigluma subsp. patula]